MCHDTRRISKDPTTEEVHLRSSSYSYLGHRRSLIAEAARSKSYNDHTTVTDCMKLSILIDIETRTEICGDANALLHNRSGQSRSCADLNTRQQNRVGNECAFTNLDVRG